MSSASKQQGHDEFLNRALTCIPPLNEFIKFDQWEAINLHISSQHVALTPVIRFATTSHSPLQVGRCARLTRQIEEGMIRINHTKTLPTKTA